MVIRLIIRHSSDPIVRTERVKLLAGGSQLVAIGILIGSAVSPFFNSSISVPLWTRFGAAGIAACFELLALRILSYIPTSSPPKEG